MPTESDDRPTSRPARGHLAAAGGLFAFAALTWAAPGLLAPCAAALGISAVARRAGGGWGRPNEAPLLCAAGIAAVLAIALVHFALVTSGTGELLAESMLGSAYDALGRSLLSGDTEIPRSAIRWEAFMVDGRPVMYFGAFPALLRIAPNALLPSFAGLWSPMAEFLAAMLCLLAFLLILQGALAANPRLANGQKRCLLTLSLLGFGFGSPLFFLASEVSIYHEAVFWGLCWGLFGITFALRLLRGPAVRLRDLLGLSVVAGAALLSRATFGGPLYLLVAWFGLVAWRDGPARTRPYAALAVAPAAAALAFQLWYNEDRFGSITTFIDFQYLGYLARDAASWSALQENGVFSVQRLPTALTAYFGALSTDWSGGFPWLRVAPIGDLDPRLYPPIFDHFAISLTFSAGWLALGGIVGTLRLFATRHAVAWRLAAFAWLAQTALVLCYYIVAQRYAADFVPFFAFGYAVLLGGAGGTRVGRLWIPCLATLVAVAVLVTTLGILAYPKHRDLPQRIFGTASTAAPDDQSAPCGVGTRIVKNPVRPPGSA
ncbi:MAG: hypothetical protein ACE5FL_03020 [Myxococcota bacterium]